MMLNIYSDILIPDIIFSEVSLIAFSIFMNRNLQQTLIMMTSLPKCLLI